MGATSAEPVAHSPGVDAVQSLLIPGERLECHVIQHRIFALTHRRLVVGASSGRLIAVQRGLISGFTTQDIRATYGSADGAFARGDFLNAASDPRGFVKAELGRPNGALLEVPGLQSVATAIFTPCLRKRSTGGFWRSRTSITSSSAATASAFSRPSAPAAEVVVTAAPSTA